MLNSNASDYTGAAVGAAARAAGLDGVQLYVSPYCNNANCKKTTGKYAEGIARMVTAIKAAAPGMAVALLLNEWDNVEIVAKAGPTALYSYQTVFYFTSISDCQRDAGALCGAGENVAYINKAHANFSQTLAYLSAHGIAWLGQLKGATTPENENPPDFWPALRAFVASTSTTAGAQSTDSSQPMELAAPPVAPAAVTAADDAAAAVAAPSSRALVIWLYSPSATAATWAGWYADLASHAGNVTGVAPCSYLMNDAGAFVSQMNASAAAMAANWTRGMSHSLGLSVVPLLAASGTGMNAVIAEPAGGPLSSAFITASVTELAAIGGAGYNVQLEEPGSPLIKARWLDFLGRWLAALDAAGGKTLAIIVGGDCRAKDWMYMDCGDYRAFAANASAPHANLRIITESTYEQEPAAWRDILANALRGLGAELLQPGLEYGPPLDNPANGCQAAAKAANVSTLYVWVNTPSAQAQWDAFGSWLHDDSSDEDAAA